MRLLLLLSTFLFVPTALAEQPSDLEILKIQTVASCVDDVFYQAGYDNKQDDNKQDSLDKKITSSFSHLTSPLRFSIGELVRDVGTCLFLYE